MLSSLTDTLARHHIANLPAAGQEGASLREALSRVPDPRARRGVRYPFVQLLQIIVHTVALDDAVNGWVRERAREHIGTDRLVIAVDGKEVRGAKNGGGGRVFLMAALDHATGTVIGQESVGEKTNEIPHFQAGGFKRSLHQ